MAAPEQETRLGWGWGRRRRRRGGGGGGAAAVVTGGVTGNGTSNDNTPQAEGLTQTHFNSFRTEKVLEIQEMP
jgi:hypothetical protein